ncbi:MAG: FHA domain-containing protein [Intrasporangium sp.]|uniref:FHA domain-containing protein FhaB/FipA n=1 Tax=Intrasporangium sp. TaxID=1925024 RepID=UPI00264730E2|nr:FHA domain-containing protein [Intrasporangium sp.]MDN5797760.1 FHA domain-containing protein [Intrasporangium sp.]
MSVLTLTLLRLGLLALLWIFIFSIVGVLRTDLYGTTVSRRGSRKARRAARKEAAAAPAPAAAPQPDAPPRGRKRRRGGPPTHLVVTEGPLAGTSLPLRGSGVLIGRNPECALVVDDDYASGRHCRIYPDGDGWAVEDLGSTNGTYLGRERLTTPRPVKVGSSLRIGKTVLELRG